jgi:hypothetical protein
MNLHEKLLALTVSSWIIGERTNVKIVGTKEQMKCLGETILKTKAVIHEMNNPDATVESLMKVLEEKSEAAKKFEKHFNIAWPI